jgi:hypothetical protein
LYVLPKFEKLNKSPEEKYNFLECVINVFGKKNIGKKKED